MAQAGREVAANDWDYPEVGTARKSGAAAFDCTLAKNPDYAHLPSGGELECNRLCLLKNPLF